MFPGYPIPGTQYVLPCLSGKDGIHFEDVGYFKRVESEGAPYVKVMIVREIAHAALKRNHPAITAEEVEAVVTFDNVIRVYWACQGKPAADIERDWDRLSANPPTP